MLLVLDGRPMVQPGMAALAVVEDLDVVEDPVGQIGPGLPPFSVQQLDLHAGPERLLSIASS